MTVKANAGYFATTKEVWDKSMDMAASNDKEGYALLALTGGLFPLSEGTRMRVLDMNLSSVRLRILDAPENPERDLTTARGDCGSLE